MPPTSTSTVTNTDDTHYACNRTVKAYHQSIFRREQGLLERWTRDLIHSHLADGSKPTDVIVDIGGGTGRDAAALHQVLGLQNDVLCVDKSREMLMCDHVHGHGDGDDKKDGDADQQQDRNNNNNNKSDTSRQQSTKPASPPAAATAAPKGVKRMCYDAAEFVALDDVRYDRCLLKEVVHHIPDPEGLYKGIFNQLNGTTTAGARKVEKEEEEQKTSSLGGGSLCLTVMRPQAPDYPLFDAALAQWKKNQLSSDEYVAIMTKAGFSDVKATTFEFPDVVKIPKQEWIDFMLDRGWSTFHYFNDEELHAGVDEVRERFKDVDVVPFRERLVFLVGRKV